MDKCLFDLAGMTITGRGLIRRPGKKYEPPALAVAALTPIITSSIKPGAVANVNIPSLLKVLAIKHPGGSAYLAGNRQRGNCDS